MIRNFEYRRDAKKEVKEDKENISTLLNIKVSVQSKALFYLQ